MTSILLNSCSVECSVSLVTGTSESFSPNTRYEAAEGFPILIVQSEHSTSTRNVARQLLGLRYVIVPVT